MNKDQAEDIIRMYGTITDNIISVLQGNSKVWNNPVFWDACNYLLQEHGYEFEVV